VDDALDTPRFSQLRLLLWDRLLEIAAGVGTTMIARVTGERLVVKNQYLTRNLICANENIDPRDEHILVIEKIHVRRSGGLGNEGRRPVGRQNDVDDIRVCNVNNAERTRNMDCVRITLLEVDDLRGLGDDGDGRKLLRADCAEACREKRGDEERQGASLVMPFHDLLTGVACPTLD
jgi:hypothetical protein